MLFERRGNMSRDSRVAGAPRELATRLAAFSSELGFFPKLFLSSSARPGFPIEPLAALLRFAFDLRCARVA